MDALPADVVRQIRRVRLAARRAVRSLGAGEYRAAFKGAGLTFEDLREYAPGDDVRRIDWNTTARTGRMMLKRFVEERELTVLVAVDLSASMHFGSAGISKRTVAAELAALVAMAALANRDRVGFIGFTDRIESHLRPGRGAGRLGRMLSVILQHAPATRLTDLAAVLREIATAHRRHALLVLLSDFQSPDFAAALRRVSRRHDVVGIRIGDAAEAQLPAVGLVQVMDSETGEPVLVDAAAPAFRAAHSAWAERNRHQVNSTCRQARAELVDVSTDGEHLNQIVQWFQRRARA